MLVTFAMLTISVYAVLLLAAATAAGRFPDKYTSVKLSQKSGFVASPAYGSKRKNIFVDRHSEFILGMKRLTKMEMSELVQGMECNPCHCICNLESSLISYNNR